MFNVPSATALKVVFKAFLASDHITPATGKTTIAITISKNGAAFANPSGGATVATEIANGWYFVNLTTTDTGTVGPLAIHGLDTGPTIDPIGVLYNVMTASGGYISMNAKLVDDAAPQSAATVATAVRTELTTELGRIDVAVSSRAATGAAMTLTTGERTAVADAFLDRDMATGTDTGVASGAGSRTARQALRFLRNKWSITAGVMTVTKENDTTASWSAAVVGTSGADPITSVDPT